MKDRPVSVDLDSLWSQLGIQLDGSSVRFDDGAKLAVRQIELGYWRHLGR